MISLPASWLRRFGVFGLLAICAPACDRAGSHSPTFPVRGEVLFGAQPATGAMVILHPLSAEDAAQAWTAGYPRGFVREDGSFSISTFGDDDGAPAGEYAVLVHWLPTSADGDAADEESSAPDEGESQHDRLGGRYLDPQRPLMRVKVQEGSNELGRLELK